MINSQLGIGLCQRMKSWWLIIWLTRFVATLFHLQLFKKFVLPSFTESLQRVQVGYNDIFFYRYCTLCFHKPTISFSFYCLIFFFITHHFFFITLHSLFFPHPIFIFQEAGIFFVVLWDPYILIHTFFLYIFFIVKIFQCFFFLTCFNLIFFPLSSAIL